MQTPKLFNNTLAVLILFAALPVSHAGPQDLLAEYQQASAQKLSIERGKYLHTQNFAQGKADTPACTSCHGKSPLDSGKTLTGKRIEPMAVSVSPNRYQDRAKVEKWFKRNCTEVLGRECTAQEKGDWLSYMLSL